jgi:hypothetical protein
MHKQVTNAKDSLQSISGLKALQDRDAVVVSNRIMDVLEKYVVDGKSSTEECNKAVERAEAVVGEGVLNKAVAEGMLRRDRVDYTGREKLFAKSVLLFTNFFIRYVRLPEEELDRVFEIADVCVGKGVLAQDKVDAAKAARGERRPCLGLGASLRQ